MTQPLAAKEPAASVDSDQDGVMDTVDLCPETISGAAIDQIGCVPMEEINLLVTFDFDSDSISSGAMAMISKMGDFMSRHPDVKIRIEGHTDSRGHEEYNQILSNQILSTKRADSVRQLLIEQYQIDGHRIESIGFGEIDPVASNLTSEGRQQNRRVIAEVIQ